MTETCAKMPGQKALETNDEPEATGESETIMIEEFCDEAEEPGGAFARGHHDPAAFLQAVRTHLAEAWGPHCAEDTLADIRPGQVTHLHWREEQDEQDDTVQFIPCEAGEGGSYPVTRVSWYGE